MSEPPLLSLSTVGEFRTNPDKFGHVRIPSETSMLKKKVEKNNTFQTSVLKFFTLVPKKDFSESASIVVKITILY